VARRADVERLRRRPPESDEFDVDETGVDESGIDEPNCKCL
jgi:hypothetical protein